MSISYLVQFSIEDGAIDDFKTLASGYIGAVRDNEPDTLRYQWFISEDGRTGLLSEGFSSDEALLTHLGNVGPTLPDLLAIAPITRFEVFGSAGAAVKEALAPFAATHHPHHGGFDR